MALGKLARRKNRLLTRGRRAHGRRAHGTRAHGRRADGQTADGQTGTRQTGTRQTGPKSTKLPRLHQKQKQCYLLLPDWTCNPIAQKKETNKKQPMTLRLRLLLGSVYHLQAVAECLKRKGRYWSQLASSSLSSLEKQQKPQKKARRLERVMEWLCICGPISTVSKIIQSKAFQERGMSSVLHQFPYGRPGA